MWSLDCAVTGLCGHPHSSIPQEVQRVAVTSILRTFPQPLGPVAILAPKAPSPGSVLDSAKWQNDVEAPQPQPHSGSTLSI